jgi:hypothetical protein
VTARTTLAPLPAPGDLVDLGPARMRVISAEYLMGGTFVELTGTVAPATKPCTVAVPAGRITVIRHDTR